MNRENILFGIIGILFGLIVGFMFANSVNRSAVPTAGAVVNQTAGLPDGHPGLGQGQTAPLSPESQQAIDKAKAEPDNFDAQISAAELTYQTQRYEAAIEFLAQANKLRPDNYEIIVHLGNANFDANRFEEAETWYSKALSLKPDDVNARTDLGLTFMFRQSTDYDRAIKEFKQSLETDPNHPQTLQNLTVAYIKKGDAANANDVLARLENIDPTNSAISRLRDDITKIAKK